MKTVKMIFNKTNISTISTTNLRKKFPSVYQSLIHRNLIGTGNIIFTREVRSLTGDVISEPYIIITKTNKVFEIKECGYHTYLDFIGDDNVGRVLRREHHRIRYDIGKHPRLLKNQRDTQLEIAQVA